MDKQNSTITEMGGTKWEIFEAAVDLFSCRGFAAVGIRNIAKAVGIKSASIYNHYPSKEAIAEEMYDFFYEHYQSRCITLEEALALIPGATPQEVLERLAPPCEGEKLYEILKKILVVALAERNNTLEAEALVAGVSHELAAKISAVLRKMLELELIEPIDIATFNVVFVNFSLSATSFSGGHRVLSFAEWRDGRRLLFQLVREK